MFLLRLIDAQEIVIVVTVESLMTCIFPRAYFIRGQGDWEILAFPNSTSFFETCW